MEPSATSDQTPAMSSPLNVKWVPFSRRESLYRHLTGGVPHSSFDRELVYTDLDLGIALLCVTGGGSILYV